MTTPTTTPTTNPTPNVPLRVSDADREVVAERLRTAVAEGRLTLAESDERQALAYAARTADDLAGLTADLPAPPPPPQRRGTLTPAARRRLAVHAAVVAVIAVFLVVRWALGPVPWFWPAWPMFWLALSVVVHHRRAARDGGVTPVPA
jgi:hypothetical protein